MGEIAFQTIVKTRKFFIIKGVATPGDAFTIHRDRDQAGYADTRSIAFCTGGRCLVYYHSEPPTSEEFTRGMRSPRYISAPSHALTCVEAGDYYCITPTVKTKFIVSGDCKTLEPSDTFDSTSQYVFIADGIVSIEGVDYEGPKIVELSSPKTLTCVQSSVISWFDVFDDV